MTLGSLFDGSGTCPLAATMCGITPVWASEIEPYPIRVTRKNFPEMLHIWGHHEDQRRGNRAGGYRYIRLALSGFERRRNAKRLD